jgi:predicted dehydrogenase
MRSFVFILTLTLGLAGISTGAEVIRIGMIGLDTSHVIAFTKLINDEKDPNHVPGGKVVAAFKGGSDDVESSYTRVDKYTEQLQNDFGVEIVGSIEKLCTMADAIMLESVDGRPHREQAKPVFEAGLPLFIDKPLAGSLKDAIAIKRLGEKHHVPWFSSSSYRYYESLQALKKADAGEIRGAISWGPCHLEPHHPDLFWYGVHPTEALYTIMGPGCQSVVRTHTDATDVVTGVWKDGKVGTLRGLRDQKTPHKVVVFGTKAVLEQEGGGHYAPLIVEVMKFFQTREVPIPPEETIEIFAFMEAADESKRRGGAPVTIDEVMKKAEAELGK